MPKDSSPTGGQLDLAEKAMHLSSILSYWKDHICDALQRAGGGIDFDSVVARVLTGNVHLYSDDDCCVLMEKIDLPVYSVYHCFIACGDMQAIMDMQEPIRREAEKLGCKEMTINGRIGWPKLLKEKGWTHRSSVLAIEV